MTAEEAEEAIDQAAVEARYDAETCLLLRAILRQLVSLEECMRFKVDTASAEPVPD